MTRSGLGEAGDLLSEGGLAKGDVQRMLTLVCDHAVRTTSACGAGIVLADEGGRSHLVAASGYASLRRGSLHVEAAATYPMREGSDELGALRLYRDAQTEPPAGEQAAAHTLAQLATSVIRLQHERETYRRLTRQLQHALNSRVLIEQAKGVLGERLGTSPDQAFDTLRRYARSHRQRLHDVAQRLIEGRLHTHELIGSAATTPTRSHQAHDRILVSADRR